MIGFPFLSNNATISNSGDLTGNQPFGFVVNNANCSSIATFVLNPYNSAIGFNFIKISSDKDAFKYWQKTSDIPEEIAKECVEVTATGLFKNYIWSDEKVQDYGMQPISTTAKESIQSAVAKEDGSFYDFIIIYKK